MVPNGFPGRWSLKRLPGVLAWAWPRSQGAAARPRQGRRDACEEGVAALELMDPLFPARGRSARLRGFSLAFIDHAGVAEMTASKPMIAKTMITPANHAKAVSINPARRSLSLSIPTPPNHPGRGAWA